MSRAATLTRAALEILNACGDYALPEEQLETELKGRVRPPCDRSEFKATITNLIQRLAVATISDDLDPTLHKFLITETGKTLLARQP